MTGRLTGRMVYLDTSAWLKLWVEESRSDAVQSLLSDPDRGFAMSSLAAVEIASVMARRVRSGDLDSAAADALQKEIYEELGEMVETGKLRVIASDDRVLVVAVDSLRRCGSDGIPLRSLDAIHVAAALTLDPPQAAFVTADHRQCRAATHLGLHVHLL